MGSLNIEYPNIPSGTAETQLGHIKSYLYQLTEKLNLADFSAEKIFEDVSKAIDAESVATESNEETAKLKEYANLKALIIKTGDYAVRNSPELEKVFESSFGASSDFGKYFETLKSEVTANAEGIRQLFTYTAGINNENGDFGVGTKQFIKSGLLYYDDNQIPVFGVGVGVISTIADDNGEIIDLEQNRLATFAADEIAFWDQGTKVAYIRDNAINFPAANIRGGSIHIGQEENNFFKVDVDGNLTIGENFSVDNAGIAKFQNKDGDVTLDLSAGYINCKDQDGVDIRLSTDGLTMRYGDTLMGRISPFVTTETGDVLRRESMAQLSRIEVCSKGLSKVGGWFECFDIGESNLWATKVLLKNLDGTVTGDLSYSESSDESQLSVDEVKIMSRFTTQNGTSYKPNVQLQSNNYGGKIILNNGVTNPSSLKVLASLEATANGTAFYMGDGTDGPWTIAEYDGKRHVHADHFHFYNKSDGLITGTVSTSECSAYIVIGQPTSGGYGTTAIIPAAIATSRQWQIADETNYINFRISADGTVTQTGGSSGSGSIIDAYSIR